MANVVEVWFTTGARIDIQSEKFAKNGEKK
jgi:hypothetical protein